MYACMSCNVTHACMYACMHACMYVMSVYVSMCVCVVCMYVCNVCDVCDACMCACMHACMHACMYAMCVVSLCHGSRASEHNTFHSIGLLGPQIKQFKTHVSKQDCLMVMVHLFFRA